MDNDTCSIPECRNPRREDSYCWGHWARWSTFGNPLDSRLRFDGASDRARLMGRVVEDPETTCWIWQGGKTHDGYGMTSLAPGTSQMAHRAVYREFLGEIVAESLDHLCRNRLCVNPEHLEPVSMKVNTHRGDTLAAAYIARTQCDNGHEFTAANTIARSDGGRRCRECKNASGRTSWLAGKRTPSRR